MMAQLTCESIETVPPGPFTDFIDNLTRRGGEAVVDHFRECLDIIGCAKSVPQRWHALAILVHLHTKYGIASPEIEAIRALFDERVVIEELKLHR